MKFKFFLFSIALLWASCQKANDKNPALLGKWQGSEWLIFDKPSGMDASKVTFEFKEDGAYTATLGDQLQNGVWRTQADKLFTTEKGKQEIMVKLLRADGEELTFEMNRSGQKETLKLKKQ